MERIDLSSAIEITKHLIKYKSITPNDDGLILELSKILEKIGFITNIVQLDDTINIYAQYSNTYDINPVICFAGHIDVVPPGDISAWNTDPFEAIVKDNTLYGRGTEDMKGAIAAFIAASYDIIQNVIPNNPDNNLSIGILLTSDEEGTGRNGIKRLIDENLLQHVPQFYLLGEPTGSYLGQTIQVGRRGSILGTLICHGIQGHVAYPHLIDNPIVNMINTLQELIKQPIDNGFGLFEPSLVQITSIDVDNDTENLTPSTITAKFVVRFNPLHTCESIERYIQQVCNEYAKRHQLKMRYSRNAYFTDDQILIDKISAVIKDITGNTPHQSASGGCTDGSFLSVLAPVIELGLPSKTLHQVNECIDITDLDNLKAIYKNILLNL